MVEIVKYLVFVLAVGVSFGSRKWCLPIFCFFLPLSQWMPEVPIPAVNAMNLLLLPVLYQAIATGGERKKKQQGDPLWFPLLLFMFFVFISWARVNWSSDLPVEWVMTGGLYNNVVTFKEFINAVVFYFCAKRLTSDPDDRLRVLSGVVAGFGFEAMTAAREFLFSGSWRATGHLGQPNKLGAFLSGYGMLAFGFLINKNHKYRLPALILVGMGVLGLLGSVSRGSMLAIMFAITGILVLRRSFWIVPLFIALLMAPMWLPEKVLSRFDEAVVESEAGGVEIQQAGRIDIWKSGLAMVADHPMGVGLEQFKYNLRAYGYTGRRTKSSHNIYVALATEQGILAFLLHVFMFGYLGVVSYRISKNGRSVTERCLGTGVLGMVLAFSISSSFGDGFYENNLSGNFWILAGTMTVIRMQILQEPPPGPRRVQLRDVSRAAKSGKNN